MKRIVTSLLSLLIVSALAATLANAQTDSSSSLADYAKQVKKQQARKPPASKHFDNDNLPKNDHLSVVGPQSEQGADAQSKPEGGSAGDADKSADQATAPNSPEEKQTFYESWKKRIADQKAAIDLNAREFDVLQREYRMRAAAMYADVGNRLRNSAQWDKEDADYKQKIADKQKSIDDAKQKLEDMQEEARKAGVPSSFRD